MNDRPISMPRSLSESNVLIMGGTAGVGLRTAIEFARKGVACIALVGRDEARGNDACNAVKTEFPDINILFIAADANDLKQATNAVIQAHQHMGRIDVLVNSTVAAFVPRLLHQTPPEEIADMLIGQMLGPLLTSRLVLPIMQTQKCGVILNIASDAGKLATPGESVIGAAMAGIVMFTRTLAMEAKRDSVRVNVITPSLIEGTLTYDRVMRDGFSAKLFEKAARMAHLGLSQPEDLAHLIVFLSSPEACRITGQAISPNGGISAA